MNRGVFFLICFTLAAAFPAHALTRAEICRQRCGADEACYAQCMSEATPTNPPKGEIFHKFDYSTKSGDRFDGPAEPAPPHADGPLGGGGPMAPTTTPAPPAEADMTLAHGHGERAISITAHDFLYGLGAEREGYGLYSYVILPRQTPRANVFLAKILSYFPARTNVTTAPIKTNLLYVPTRIGSIGKFTFSGAVSPEEVQTFLKTHYDFDLANRLLENLCNPPDASVARTCRRDLLAGGPYLLTYETKISNMSPLPPPFLFVDLTRVNQRAFDYFISIYAADVKDDDFAAGRRLHSFRTLLYGVTLTAADVVGPVASAWKSIVNLAGPAEAKPNPGK